jgi:adenosylhomocysteine nucleosidase
VKRNRVETRIAILAPMPSELRPLVRGLALKPSRTGGRSLLRSIVGRTEIVATTTGIGTRAAASKAEMIFDASSIDHLVVVGIAGGIGPSVDIGDLVIPEIVIDHASGMEYRPSFLGLTAARGKLVTSDEAPMDLAEVARLEQLGVIAVDMETAAIAAVCEARRCPWSVFRAISDRADDGSTDAEMFALTTPDGKPDLPAVLRFVFKNPKRIPQLASLARGSTLAANNAASAAISAIREMQATYPN